MTFYVHILRPGLMGQWREKKYGERVEYGVWGKNINAKGGFVGIGWECVLVRLPILVSINGQGHDMYAEVGLYPQSKMSE
jgi:hypothetical protein